VLGDRRDHFESVKDVWGDFPASSRKSASGGRSIRPCAVLQECVGELKKFRRGGAYTRERLEKMLEFIMHDVRLVRRFVSLPTGALKGMARRRGKLKLLLGGRTKNNCEMRQGVISLASEMTDSKGRHARGWLFFDAECECSAPGLQTRVDGSHETARPGRGPLQPTPASGQPASAFRRMS